MTLREYLRVNRGVIESIPCPAALTIDPNPPRLHLVSYDDAWLTFEGRIGQRHDVRWEGEPIINPMTGMAVNAYPRTRSTYARIRVHLDVEVIEKDGETLFERVEVEKWTD